MYPEITSFANGALLDTYHVILQCNASAITLPEGELYVGRSHSCFLRVDDPLVSRLHLRIIVGQHPMIEDLRTTNGTLLNGQPLTELRPLADGDVLVIGSRTLTVHLLEMGSVQVEQEDPTPSPVLRGERSTHSGVGPGIELEGRCPECGASVPAQTKRCPRCGHQWGAGRPGAPTQPENHTVSASPAVTVKIRARYVSPSLKVEGEVDLTARGAFMSTSRLDSLGTSCALEVGDGEGKVVLRGFVRTVIRKGVKKSSGMGVEFVGLSPEARRWLDGQLGGVRSRS